MLVPANGLPINDTMQKFLQKSHSHQRDYSKRQKIVNGCKTYSYKKESSQMTKKSLTDVKPRVIPGQNKTSKL